METQNNRCMLVSIGVLGIGVVATLVMTIVLLTRNPTAVMVQTTTMKNSVAGTSSSMQPTTASTSMQTQSSTAQPVPAVYSTSLVDPTTHWPASSSAIAQLMKTYQTNITGIVQKKYPGSSVYNVSLSQAQSRILSAAQGMVVSYKINIPASAMSTPSGVSQAINTAILSSGYSWTPNSVTQISGPTPPPPSTSTSTTTTTGPPMSSTPPPIINWSPGFLDAAEMLKANIDPSVNPCQDFYQHACGGFMAKNIPTPSVPSISTFRNLQNQILQNISKSFTQSSASVQATWPKSVQIAALFYKTCVRSFVAPPPEMSNGSVMLTGIQLISNQTGWPMIQQNYNLDFSAVEALMTQLSVQAVPNLFTPSIDVDWQNTNQYSLYIDQATLAMDRKFFINPLFGDIRSSYLNLITNVSTTLSKDLGTFGTGNVTQTTINADALTLFNYEIGLANKMVPSEEQRVFSSQFNSFNLTSLEKRWPFIQWGAYFTNLLTYGNMNYLNNIMNNTQGIVITQPRFIDEFHDGIVAGGLQKTVVNYLVWRWVYANLQFLPGPYRAAHDKFQKSLNNLAISVAATEQQCAGMLVQYMPFATGYVYANNFNTLTQSDVNSMTTTVVNSFSNMLTQVSWLDTQSLKNAQNKVSNVAKNIAFPQWLWAPGALDVHDATYIQMLFNNSAIQNDILQQSRFIKYAFAKNQFSLLSQSVNRNLWPISPASVASWSSKSMNSITFPASIMNPPFYRVDFPQAVKYGGLGAAIAQKLSHGFNDQGSQFDSTGKLNPMYSSSSMMQFENMASCVISEYNQFCYPAAELNLCINGRNTQGENIADLAGILAAYSAYQNWVSLHLNGQQEPHLPGLEKYSANQVFFLSYANQFCESASSSQLVHQLITDSHSTGKYRVLGSLMNSDVFGIAFNCPRGSPLLPPVANQCPVYRPVPTSPPMPTLPPPTASQAPSNSAGWSQASQIISNNMDTSFDPCKDFYSFSCNKWIQNHPLQSHQSSRSMFGMAQTNVFDSLVSTLQNVNPKSSSKTITAAWSFYESCIQAQGSNTPYGTMAVAAFTSATGTTWPMITSNFSIPQGFDLWHAVSALDVFYSTPTLLTSFITVDYKKISRNALYTDQATLGLGSIEYYTKDQFANVRAQYLQTIISVSTLLASENNVTVNQQQINQDAQDILAFEINIARIMQPQSKLTDFQAMFNQYNISALMSTYPKIGWQTYHTQLMKMHGNLTVLQNRFVISIPSYINSLSTLLHISNNRTVINFLGWRYFWNNLMFVGPAYSQAYLDVLKVRDGVKALPPSSHTCVGLLMGYMQFAAGRLYVQNYPNLQAIRTDIAFQTRRIVHAFQQMVQNLQWMDDASKRLANRKAAGLIQNDLYPDWILDDQKLDTYHSTYIANITNPTGSAFFLNLRSMRYGRAMTSLVELTQPANRLNFLESPALVNAWYQPERNSITFPLGILQSPYYQLNFPQAFNYGGQGATAGHELSHGFDNSGVQFFTNGTLYTWMTQASQQNFNRMTQCVVRQYSSYCYPAPINLCIKGDVTLGENIADIAGIRAAYYAYQDYVAYNGPEPPLPNLTNYTMNQVFFMAYANGWCTNQSPSSLTNQLVLNVHSPAKWRVNGVLADMPEFAQAFNCPIGSVEATNQCTVW